MKKTIKFIPLLTSAVVALSSAFATTVNADFSDYGKHWYYSDDIAFRYWGLTEVNNYGMPKDDEAVKNIDFNGATPQNKYQIGTEDYSVIVNVYGFPTTINAKIGMRGDTTSDGIVDLYDAIFVASYLIGTNKFDSEFHEFLGDYNIDARTDIYDVIEISKSLMQQDVIDDFIEEQLREEYVSEVAILVNEERAKQGLSPLTMTTELNQAAQIRAEEISTQYDIQHTRPDGSSCFTVLDEMNIKCNYAGENIAGGYTSPEAVVQGWMDSPDHRANILDPYFTKIGVGYYKNDTNVYVYYWSQFFIQD